MSSSQAPLPPHSAPPTRQRGQTLPVVAVVLALVALGLSAWASFRPTSTSSTPTYSATEQADAKKKICGAADLVRKGVSLNTNLQPPGGPEDVTGSLAVAANARLSLSDGGQYLVSRLDPATPADVSDAVRKFAGTLMDIGAAATAGMQNTEPDQAARLRDADAQNARVTEVCK